MDLKSIKQAVSNFLNDEEGASAIEYALIAALIAVAIVIAAGLLGEEVSNLFDTIRGHLETA